MRAIRVMVVDDALTIRHLVTTSLKRHADIDVVGSASNGDLALKKIPECKPDLIILDVDMPKMDGLECLRQIRQSGNAVPVVMFSALTEKGAQVTIDALYAGANDYLEKPALKPGESLDDFLDAHLLPKIRALTKRMPALSRVPTKEEKEKKRATREAARTERVRTTVASKVEILAVGCSTGGPNALAEVIPLLRANFPVPIVIVQHMPPMFTRLLAERLHKVSKNRVVEAKDGDSLEAGTVYLAPGDFHMVISGRTPAVLKLNKDPQENGCRPAVDPLFRSVAKHYGANSLAVVLTGMGKDGLVGCEHISEQGGQILAQDKATSVVWGMPGYVAETGLAEKVLPIGEIAAEIEQRVFRHRAGGTP